MNVRPLIWHYTNRTVPSLKFWQRSHEAILCCWKGKSRPKINRDNVRVPYTSTFLRNSAGKTRKTTKGRFGVKETTADDDSLEDGLTAPDFAAYGYRVYLKFRDHTSASQVGAILCIPNCCITEHSLTLGADATTEESITLQSYLDPLRLKEGGRGAESMVADATGF